MGLILLFFSADFCSWCLCPLKCLYSLIFLRTLWVFFEGFGCLRLKLFFQIGTVFDSIMLLGPKQVRTTLN